MAQAQTYELIEAKTLTGTTLSLDFINIPQGYTDLRLVTMLTRGTQANAGDRAAFIKFNDDGSNGYSRGRMYAAGAASGGAASADTDYSTSGMDILGTGDAAYGKKACTVDIFSYTNTGITKTLTAVNSNSTNSNGAVFQYAGHWNSYTAISKITIYTVTDSFQVGDTLNLYGILRA